MNKPTTSSRDQKGLALSAPRTVLGLLLAASSAALLTLAFPPFNLGLLIWVGFVPMSVAQHRVLPGRISSLAPAVAITGWLGALLVPAFGGKSWLMTVLPLAIFVLVLATDRKKRAFHGQTAYVGWLHWASFWQAGLAAAWFCITPGRAPLLRYGWLPSSPTYRGRLTGTR